MIMDPLDGVAEESPGAVRTGAIVVEVTVLYMVLPEPSVETIVVVNVLELELVGVGVLDVVLVANVGELLGLVVEVVAGGTVVDVVELVTGGGVDDVLVDVVDGSG